METKETVKNNIEAIRHAAKKADQFNQTLEILQTLTREGSDTLNSVETIRVNINNGYDERLCEVPEFLQQALSKALYDFFEHYCCKLHQELNDMSIQLNR